MRYAIYIGLGMLGGLVLAVVNSQNHTIDIAGHSCPLPIIGEVFIGGVTALAAVFVMAFVTGANPGSDDVHIRLCGVSLLAGFLGIRLLQSLAVPILPESIAKQLEQHTEQIDALEKLQQARSHALEAEVYFELARNALASSNNARTLARSKLQKSLRYFDNALELVPEDTHTLIWKARALKLLYVVDDNEEFLAQAIDLVQPIAELDLTDETVLHSRACYNCACYHCLNGSNSTVVLGWLAKAIEGRPDYAENARTDADFENIRSEISFQEIVGLQTN